MVSHPGCPSCSGHPPLPSGSRKRARLLPKDHSIMCCLLPRSLNPYQGLGFSPLRPSRTSKKPVMMPASLGPHGRTSPVAAIAAELRHSIPHLWYGSRRSLVAGCIGHVYICIYILPEQSSVALSLCVGGGGCARGPKGCARGPRGCARHGFAFPLLEEKPRSPLSHMPGLWWRIRRANWILFRVRTASSALQPGKVLA